MLNDRLSELIDTLGIKKGAFSASIGFSQAHVSMILSGRRPHPSDRFFDAVSRQFQVNAQWLKNGSGDMFVLPGAGITDSDRELIKKYKSLPIPERKVIDEIIDAMVVRNLNGRGDA